MTDSTHTRRRLNRRLVTRLLVAASVALVLATGQSLASTAASAWPVMAPESPSAVMATDTTQARRTADTAGSVAVGTTQYSPPAGALYVAPYGMDAGSGSLSAPWRTIAYAVSRAPSGSTIVLRRGAYHESIAIESKQLTIQNYPGEAAWMDGSSVVTGWAQSGNTWVKEGWTARFDHSPTFFRGALDYTAPGWNFVNPAYPMAAHPDQMWVDGVVQQQVDSLAKVAPGTFYLDEATSRLYLGTDPTNRLVRASDLAKALSVRGAGSVIRGLGIVRYAPSVWQIGAVSFERPGIVAEDLTVGESATAGIGVTAANITLNRVTVDNNGLMGVLANEAYGLRMTRSRIVRNNDEHFNTSPAAGGMKITRSRGIVIQDSDFRDNLGTGMWFDESDYGITVAGNNFVNNANHGTFLELSSTATVVDNVYLGNLNTGLQVNDTDRVQVWNNTFVGNGRAVNVVQDPRRASDTSAPGHDRARPLPDPTVSWVVKDVSIVNNVVAQPNTRANCMVCVEDYSHVFSAEQMQVSLRTNIYNRTTGWPTWFAVWSRGPGNPLGVPTLAAFQTATSQDAGSYAFDGSSEVDSTGSLSPKVLSLADHATALPADLAATAGLRAGTIHFGAWGV